MSNALEAVLVHCSHYLHSAHMTIERILHPQLTEPKKLQISDEFVPKALLKRRSERNRGGGRDLHSNELMEALRMSGIAGVPITELITEMFDAFMSAVLGDVVDYLNQSEERKIVAHNFKVEKEALNSLTQRMLSEARKMLDDRLQKSVTETKATSMELSRQMESRIQSLKAEVEALKAENISLQNGGLGGLAVTGSANGSTALGGEGPVIDSRRRFIVLVDAPNFSTLYPNYKSSGASVIA
jgi:hypothetical protein